MIYKNLKILSQGSKVSQEELPMEFKITLEPAVALFYSRIARANGLPLEQVLCDALFKLAAELSLEALQTMDISE
jgi:antitoxin component of RelBE/YafQ-DinJ toxin-antitoxin module